MQRGELPEEKQKNELAYENDEKKWKGQTERGAGNNYNPSGLLMLRASAITWQSTEAPSPIAADIKTSRPCATWAEAAACTQ
jgi:hypothetical protein